MSAYVFLVLCENAGLNLRIDRYFSLYRVFEGIWSRYELPQKLINLLRSADLRYAVYSMLVFMLTSFVGMRYVMKEEDRLLRRIYDKRILIGAAIIIIYVALNLNGTSLHMWSKYLEGAKDQYPLWGAARSIRSDEWAVWSVFAISQDYEQYAGINPLIAGGGIDPTWISIGGLPALNLALLFKPLYWGFLLFGFERGLSVLWILRLFLLFSVSLYFAKIYTNQNVHLSVLAALLLTFSPYVQWFFSQSIAEVLLLAQGMMICVYRYVKADRKKSRVLWALLLAYCLGCYVMIGYPAWLISVLYLVLAVSAMVLIIYRKRLCWKDAGILLVPLASVIVYLMIIVFHSMDTLNAVSQSVYPGERLFTGKYISDSFRTGLYPMTFLWSAPPFSNHCELSGFLTFAPLGMLLAIYGQISNRKVDPFSAVLTALEIFAFYVMVFGVPEWFAKITLLSQCTRLEPFMGLTDMMLLFRGLSRYEIQSKKWAIGLAVALSALSIYSIYNLYHPSVLLILIFASIYLVIYYLLCAHAASDRMSTRQLVFVLAIIAIMSGAFVNPVQKGLGCISELNVVKALKSIEDEKDDVYVFEGDWPMTNVPLLAGKKSEFSTQVYPDTEKWKDVDPDGEYSNVYNRFCHISLHLTEENTTFSLLGGDLIDLNLSVTDMKGFDVDYVITEKEYPEIVTGVNFMPVEKVDNYTIYKIMYE